jgi:hypothetical protein
MRRSKSYPPWQELLLNAFHYSAGNPDRFSGRELSFMRDLLHADYLAHRGEICIKQVAYMQRYPGTVFYTEFRYGKGPVEIEVCGVDMRLGWREWDLDWAYATRRLAQCAGMMSLHLMVVWERGRERGHMFPMRSRDSQLNDRLEHIARSAQPEDWPRLVVVLLAQDHCSIH